MTSCPHTDLYDLLSSFLKPEKEIVLFRQVGNHDLFSIEASIVCMCEGARAHTHRHIFSQPQLQIMGPFRRIISIVGSTQKWVYGHRQSLPQALWSYYFDLTYLTFHGEGLHIKFKPLKPALTYPHTKSTVAKSCHSGITSHYRDAAQPHRMQYKWERYTLQCRWVMLYHSTLAASWSYLAWWFAFVFWSFPSELP